MFPSSFNPSYHELRTDKQIIIIVFNPLLVSVTKEDRNFPEQRDSNPRDPYLEEHDNGNFVGRESQLGVHFVSHKRISLDEVAEESGR